MAQFTTKERTLARLLSSSPRIKGIIKRIYVVLTYIVHKKNYKYKITFDQKKEIKIIEPLSNGEETFFGYYDKSPENSKGWIIFNETGLSTAKKPSANKPIWINVINTYSRTVIPISDSYSYNWQQGCRAQWISEDRLIYNFFNNSAKQYKSAVYSISNRSVERVYDLPVQDSFYDKYFLSLNYNRIMRLRPDYGYRNLPLPTDRAMQDTSMDGIWKVDYSTGSQEMIVSLQEVMNLKATPSSNPKKSFHKLNHVMISPNGKQFIFIHRWYTGKQRHDRLLLSDFSNIKVISDEDMVSHMCWIDNETLFGYLRHNGTDGFYFININTGAFSTSNKIDHLKSGDGHPSYCNGRIVFDSYPDKSRMQHLYLYNIKNDTLYHLLEVFQSPTYQGESRCDLHPRFSPDGGRVYFDTVYKGHRRLAFIDITSINT